MAHRTAGWCSHTLTHSTQGGARGGGGSLATSTAPAIVRGLPGRRNELPKLPRSSGSFTGRYERARRALRAKRRAALLGFPLPAAQRVDARYEKTYSHGRAFRKQRFGGYTPFLSVSYAAPRRDTPFLSSG